MLYDRLKLLELLDVAAADEYRYDSRELGEFQDHQGRVLVGALRVWKCLELNRLARAQVVHADFIQLRQAVHDLGPGRSANFRDELRLDIEHQGNVLRGQLLVNQLVRLAAHDHDVRLHALNFFSDLLEFLFLIFQDVVESIGLAIEIYAVLELERGLDHQDLRVLQLCPHLLICEVLSEDQAEDHLRERMVFGLDFLDLHVVLEIDVVVLGEYFLDVSDDLADPLRIALFLQALELEDVLYLLQQELF